LNIRVITIFIKYKKGGDILKKLWKYLSFVLLILVIVATIKSILGGNIKLILNGLICVAFSGSLVLKNILVDKNKIVEIVFQISGSILVIANILGLFWGIYIFY